MKAYWHPAGSRRTANRHASRKQTYTLYLFFHDIKECSALKCVLEHKQYMWDYLVLGSHMNMYSHQWMRYWILRYCWLSFWANIAAVIRCRCLIMMFSKLHNIFRFTEISSFTYFGLFFSLFCTLFTCALCTKRNFSLRFGSIQRLGPMKEYEHCEQPFIITYHSENWMQGEKSAFSSSTGYFIYFLFVFIVSYIKWSEMKR